MAKDHNRQCLLEAGRPRGGRQNNKASPGRCHEEEAVVRGGHERAQSGDNIAVA
ncbi:MAG: hypothetical protein U5L96_15295 [Owenweeksia sp.]|nr:hypothetical protein [Owenweeksia sp.]